MSSERLQPSDHAPTAGLLLALAGSLLLGASACASQSDRFSYSGTVQADSASVGSTTGGRVVGVLASDGQRVTARQVLVRFDDRQQRAAFDVAMAQQNQAAASLNDLLAGPRQADIDKAAAAAAQAQAFYRRAQLVQPQQTSSAEQAVREAQASARAARAAAVNAARDYARAKQLYSQGAISSQAMDAARTASVQAAGAFAGAGARLHAAQAQLSAVRSGSVLQDVAAAANAAAAAEAELALVRQGARPEQIAQARAALIAASSNVAAARARLDETVVRSPADGLVNGLELHPGDLVAAGNAVATIDEFGDPWIRIYIGQSDLQRVKATAAVDVRSDAFPGRTFSGRIEAIDANAQFTPRDVQTAADRAGLTFGVKVRVRDPDRLLRSGTTAAVALP
jgi:multidrug resistance efflux pump